MVVLGEVCNEGHRHTHVDASPDGDGQHSQEESPSGAGAGLVKVPFGHCLVCLTRKEQQRKRKMHKWVLR